MGYFNYSSLLDGIPPQGLCQHVDAGNKSSKAYCSNPDLRDVININPGHTLLKMSHEIYGRPTPNEIRAKDLPEIAPMNGFVDYHANVEKIQEEQLQDLMSSFNPESIPVIHTLAKEYGLLSRF
jgi:hypothetical protein